ncbi:MAG: DUF2892 domain-containing protein [Capnocytophaga sp.]|nr:DUF2892 domain-containing protein [Capnocytophaga sp.]
MKRNVGKIDKLIRLSIVIIIAILGINGIISGWVASVLGAVSIIFLVTSLINFCPLYALFGINSCKFDPKKNNN